MFLWVPMFSQTVEIKKEQKVSDLKNDSLLLSRLTKTRIVFKDGSIKKNCRITEIREYWIVYEKDGSTHDQMIEKIARIEFNDGMKAIFFDEKNNPKVQPYDK